MADLTVQKADLDGLALNYVAADALGDTFTNDGETVLAIKNDGAASITATIESVKPCSYGFDHDVTVTVGVGEEKICGPFSVARFNDSNKKVSVSYTDVTSVSVAAMQVK